MEAHREGSYGSEKGVLESHRCGTTFRMHLFLVISDSVPEIDPLRATPPGVSSLFFFSLFFSNFFRCGRGFPDRFLV